MTKVKSFFVFYSIGFLMVGVAVFQLYLAQFQHLNHSSGGGFGMFAYIDSHVTRIVRVYLGKEGFYVPLYYYQNRNFYDLNKLKIHFSDKNLENAARLINTYHYQSDRRVAVPLKEGGDPRFPDEVSYNRIRFELHTIVFDPETHVVSLKKIDSREHYVD